MNPESIEYAEAWTAALTPAPVNIIAFPVPSEVTPVTPEVTAPKTLTASEIAEIERIVDGGRNEVIAAIRRALKARSGKAWSVTGGRGTAWGWIKVDAPPARCTWSHRLKPGMADWPENYEPYDTGEPGRGTSPEDIAELSALLGKQVHCQGESIPASHDYQRVAVCQALHGHAGPFKAEPYWD